MKELQKVLIELIEILEKSETEQVYDEDPQHEHHTFHGEDKEKLRELKNKLLTAI